MVEINGKEIRNYGRPFIVAEAGINHNGDLPLALEMIAIAHKTGADAIKFQTFKAEEFIRDSKLEYTYKSQGKMVTESMLEMFRRHEFSPHQWKTLKEKCDEVGILFLSTPQNKSDLDLLLSLGIPAIKVGSDDFINLPLIKSYGKTGLPIILSCGMADLSEIDMTLQALGTFQGYPTVLLLCTSQYPAPPQDVNLLKVKTLMETFPTLSVGFSDHTQGVTASIAAVGLGCCFFEKHFTLSHDLSGPDHWFSEDPHGLSDWVTSIRTAYMMMGDGDVRPTEEEMKMRTLARRSITTMTEIRKGDTFTSQNIGLQRPGDGLPPALFDQIIGQHASQDLKKGVLLDAQDIDEGMVGEISKRNMMKTGRES